MMTMQQVNVCLLAVGGAMSPTFGDGLGRDFPDLGPAPAVLPPWSMGALLALVAAAAAAVVIPAAARRLRRQRNASSTPEQPR
jgi:hypothetical protein